MVTLQLHPTNGMVFIWGPHPGQYYPPAWAGFAKKTCSVCRYELIGGWCSRCDLEENGVLV